MYMKVQKNMVNVESSLLINFKKVLIVSKISFKIEPFNDVRSVHMHWFFSCQAPKLYTKMSDIQKCPNVFGLLSMVSGSQLQVAKLTQMCPAVASRGQCAQ